MRAFGLAFTLWMGTILLSCVFTAAWSLSMMSISGVFFVMLGGIVVMIITCPLLIPTTILINLADKIPYNETIRVLWLGFALLVLNFLFFETLNWMLALDELKILFFSLSSISLVFMLIFKRSNLKQFFSEQTENIHS